MPPSTNSWLDWFVGRAVVSAFLVFLTCVLLVDLALLPLPGYVLIVGFDVLEATFGSAGSAYATLLTVYFYALAVVLGNAYRLARLAADGGRASRKTVGNGR